MPVVQWQNAAPPALRLRVQVPPGTYQNALVAQLGDAAVSKTAWCRFDSCREHFGDFRVSIVDFRFLILILCAVLAQLAEPLGFQPGGCEFGGSCARSFWIRGFFGLVAQWVEHPPSKRRDAGSTPAGAIARTSSLDLFDLVAQWEERRFPEPEVARVRAALPGIKLGKGFRGGTGRHAVSRGPCLRACRFDFPAGSM